MRISFQPQPSRKPVNLRVSACFRSCAQRLKPHEQKNDKPGGYDVPGGSIRQRLSECQAEQAPACAGLFGYIPIFFLLQR